MAELNASAAALDTSECGHVSRNWLSHLTYRWFCRSCSLVGRVSTGARTGCNALLADTALYAGWLSHPMSDPPVSSATFRLQAVPRSKLYVSIVDQIIDGINSGAFPPGTGLPPERQLSTELGVSRGSLREAVRVLEHAGLLEVRTGSGTFVTEDSLSKSAQLRAHVAAVGEHSPLDVITVRSGLEPLCVEQAALHRHERDIQVLRASINEQQTIIGRSKDPFSTDLGFHVGLATASHNPVLVAVFDRLANVMRQKTWVEFSTRVRAGKEHQELYLNQHRAILDAVERADPKEAVRAMTAHITAIRKRLLAQVE